MREIIKKLTITLTATLITTTTISAHADSLPNAMIIVKNNESQEIIHSFAERQILHLKYDITPQMKGSIKPSEETELHVLNKTLGSNLEITLNFHIPSLNPLNIKKCIFKTQNNPTSNPDGTVTYNWTANAISENGAICSSNITNTNQEFSSWTVEFHMG